MPSHTAAGLTIVVVEDVCAFSYCTAEHQPYMCRSVSGTRAGRIEVSAAASRMWRPSSECQAVGAFLYYIANISSSLDSPGGQRSAAVEQPYWANGYGNVVIGSRAACRRQLPPLDGAGVLSYLP